MLKSPEIALACNAGVAGRMVSSDFSSETRSLHIQQSATREQSSRMLVDLTKWTALQMGEPSQRIPSGRTQSLFELAPIVSQGQGF